MAGDNEDLITTQKLTIDGVDADKTIQKLQSRLNELEKTLNKINKTGIRFPKDVQKTLEALSELDTKALKKFSSGGPEAVLNRSAISGISNQTLWTNPAYMANELNKTSRKVGKALSDNFIQSLSNSITQGALTNKLNKIVSSASPAITGSVSMLKNYEKAFNLSRENLTSQFVSGGIADTNYYNSIARLNDAYDKTVGSVKNLNMEQERLRKTGTGSLALIQAKLIANYAIINSVTKSFSYLLNYVVEFDQELKNLQAITNVSDQGLIALKDTIIDVANATKFTSLEITKASVVLGQAGLSVQQIKDTLPAIAQLATATGTDLDTATQTITTTLNVYELQVGEATQVTNALTTAVNESKADISGFQYALQYAGKSANDLGVSFSETAAAVAALTQAGIKSKSTLGTGLRAVFVDLLAPTKKLEAQLEKVGLTTEDVDIKSRGFVAVLKSLRDAGFGVEEAYRGMERRGASALVSLLGQLDFMDELQEKMTGSTAAVKANEKQMGSLSNTWSNTKSVVGSLVYEGINPLVEGLQTVLETTNNLLQSTPKLVTNFAIWATVGGSVAASLILIVKTIGSIKNALATAVAGGGLLSLFGATSLSGVLALVAAIGAVAGGLSLLFQTINKAGKDLDKMTFELEKQRGELGKAEEAYNSFSNKLDEVFIKRDRFVGEGGKREIDLFVNEMMTRFPQVSEILQQPINSFEELIEVIIQAREELAKLKLEGAVATPEAANRVTTTAAKIYGKGLSYNKTSEAIDMLSRSNLMNTSQASYAKSLLNQTTFKPVEGKDIGIDSSLGREIGLNIDASLRSALAVNRKETLSNIDRLLANPKTPQDLKDYLNKFKDEIKANDKVLNTQLENALDSSINEWKKSSYTQSQDLLKEYKADYQGYREKGNTLFSGSADLYFYATESKASQAEALLNELNNGIDNLISKKEFEPLLKRLDIDKKELLQQFKNRSGEAYVSLVNQIDGFINQITEENQKLLDFQLKNRSRTLNYTIQKGLKNLEDTSQKDLESEVNRLKTIAREAQETEIDLLKNEFEKTFGVEAKQEESLFNIFQSGKIGDIKAQYDELIKNIDNQYREISKNFELESERRNAYFKAIDTTSKSIAKNYDLQLSQLESAYQYQEGFISGLGDMYDSSIMASVIQMQLDNQKRKDVGRRYDIASSTLKKYQDQLRKLESNPEYANVTANRESAERAYNEALKDSKTTTNELKNLRQSLDNATTIENKYISNVDSLNNKIQSLTNEVESLRGVMAAYGYHTEGTPFSNMAKGIGLGGQKYVLEAQRGPFSNLTEGFGEVSYQAINGMQTAFEDLFTTIKEGSFSASDSFRAFGETILETISKVMIQAAATKFTEMLVNLGIAAFSAGTAPTTGLQGTWSGSGATSPTNVSFGLNPLGMAHGGLVNGPIKNRDSVYTRLMPGEFIMKKSAVENVGVDFLNSLNSGNQEMVDKTSSEFNNNPAITQEGKGSGTVNVWVVTPDQVPPADSTNIITTVGNDIKRNGSLKKLIKQVSLGNI